MKKNALKLISSKASGNDLQYYAKFKKIVEDISNHTKKINFQKNLRRNFFDQLIEWTPSKIKNVLGIRYTVTFHEVILYFHLLFLIYIDLLFCMILIHVYFILFYINSS